MLSNIGALEIGIIAGVIFLFLGGRKIKELARGLGESKREVKKIKDDLIGGTAAEPAEAEEDM